MYFNKILILTLQLFILTFSIQAEEEDCSQGSCFKKSVNIDGIDLPLRGVARFRYYFFKVYDGALYLPQTEKSIEIGNYPIRLELVYLRDIEKNDLISPATDFLSKHSTIPISKLSDRLTEINKYYQSVTKGDRYSLEFVPGKGTKLFFNGKEKVVIPGDDFAKEYLAIWLSKNTQAKSFRKKLISNLNQ